MRGGIINGVRLDTVAQLVGRAAVEDYSDDEARIARTLRRLGQKLERDGYMPDMRRAIMRERMINEAKRCEGPDDTNMWDGVDVDAPPVDARRAIRGLGDA